MEEKERKELLKQIKHRQKEVKNSKEAAAKFLTELGILDPNGNFKKQFIPAP